MDLADDVSWPEDSLAAQFADAVRASLMTWRDGWLGPLSGTDMTIAEAESPPARFGALLLRFSCSGGRAVAAGPREYALRVDAAALLALIDAAEAVAPKEESASARARPAPTLLTALPRAIAHLPVRVCVRLDAATLHFGQLSELHPGDVIPLTHPLARPASLALDLGTDSGEGLGADALLGRQGGRFAVRIDPR